MKELTKRSYKSLVLNKDKFQVKEEEPEVVKEIGRTYYILSVLTKTNWQDTLSAYLSRSPVMSNPTTVATIMNSDPNIATKTNEVQAVEDKLTEAKDRLKNIQKNVTERYKGTGATKQTINSWIDGYLGSGLLIRNISNF